MAEYYRQAAAQEEAKAEAAAQAQPETQGPGGEQQVSPLDAQQDAPPPGEQEEAQVGVVVLGGPPNIIEVTGAEFREHLVAQAQLSA